MTERKDYYILRDWLLSKVIPMLSPEGVWMAPDPAPLTAEEVERAFGEIRADNRYIRQRLITATEDGKVVTMAGGEITTEDILHEQPQP